MELLVVVIVSLLSLVNSKVSEVHLSCRKIRAFIDGHNARRLLLAQGKVPGHPAASEMKLLVWDEELHRKAAKWATESQKKGGSTHKHNPDKTIPSDRFKTSENLYTYSTSDLKYRLNPDSALDAWFMEHKNYTFGPLQMRHFSSKHPQIGHYTQMVWSDSTYVGCAISVNIKQDSKDYFVVCNYGPAGNFIRNTPYTTGSHASGRLICGNDDCRHPYGKKC